MLSAGPCQREIRKILRTARMSNAAMIRLIKGASDSSLPANENIPKGLASRSAVSHFTPITNPFETIDMTKPKQTPQSTPLPVTFSRVANLKPLPSLCFCMAFQAPVSHHSGRWCRHCRQPDLPVWPDWDGVARLPTIENTNMKLLSRRDFLPLRHKICTNTSLRAVAPAWWKTHGNRLSSGTEYRQRPQYR